MTPTTSRQPLNHLLLLLALLLSGQSWAGIGVANLRVENLKEPLGIDTSQPRRTIGRPFTITLTT